MSLTTRRLAVWAVALAAAGVQASPAAACPSLARQPGPQADRPQEPSQFVYLRDPRPDLPVELVGDYEDPAAKWSNDLRLSSLVGMTAQGRPLFRATGEVAWASQGPSPFLTGNLRNIRVELTAGLPTSRLDISALDVPLPFHGRCWSPRAGKRGDSRILVLADKIVGVNVTVTPAKAPGGAASRITTCGSPVPGPAASARAPESAPVGDTRPRVLKSVRAGFTPEARKARVTGKVVLSFVVTRAGRADAIEVVSGLGAGLDEAAVAALKQWTFAPGTKNGEPVETPLKVEFAFDLK